MIKTVGHRVHLHLLGGSSGDATTSGNLKEMLNDKDIKNLNLDDEL
jgi:hypothetical protein